MYEIYKDKCNIFIIYINEAHAADIWNIGESAGTINYSHKVIEDRIKCAQKFADEHKMKIPVYCDNMNNDAEVIFSAWPVRYYIVSYKKALDKITIDLIGEPDDSQFDVLEIFNFLDNKMLIKQLNN